MSEHTRDVSAAVAIHPLKQCCRAKGDGVRQRRVLVTQSRYEFHWLGRSACSVRPSVDSAKPSDAVARQASAQGRAMARKGFVRSDCSGKALF